MKKKGKDKGEERRKPKRRGIKIRGENNLREQKAEEKKSR